MPGKQEFVDGFGARRNRPRQANRADVVALLRLGTERAIGGEIVPKEQRAGPPPRAFPTAQVSNGAVPALRTASAKEPALGSVAASDGLVMNRPSSPAPRRYSFTRNELICLGAPAGPTGLSSEKTIDVFALSGPGLRTWYRKMATGRPESSSS